jgi:RNA polymerase sigma factor (sigma-70 family)
MSTSRASVLLHHVRRLLGSRRDAGSDHLLLDRFVRQRDEQAFAVLMSRYAPLVWSACRRVSVQEQDAEDVFQATFLLLARKAGTIRKAASVGSWLFGVAYRLALRGKADAARRRLHEGRAVPPAVPDHSADVTWREVRAVLDEELARLPDRYRAPLLLCYFEGLTQEEAANRLGWSKRSVKNRLERGRNRLRTRLTRRGLSLSAALVGTMLAPGTSDAAVPGALADATRQAALRFALRQPLPATTPARALALAEGGLKAMVLSRLVAVTTGLLAVVLLGSAGLLIGYGGRAADPPPASPPVGSGGSEARVDRQGDPLPAGAVTRLGTVRFRTGGSGPRGLGFLPDGKTIVTAGYEAHAVQLWEAGTGKLLREIGTGPLSVRGFALSPNGKSVALAGFLPFEEGHNVEGAIGIRDVASGKEVRTLSRTGQDVDHCTMAFTPDGKLLASLGDNGILRIEEIASGVEILQQKFPRDIVATLAFSADGSLLAVSSGPNTHKLYVWKWQAGEEPRELKAPRYAGRSLAFSPDGTRLAECGDVDQVVRVWDVAGGRLLHKLSAPESDQEWFSALAFTPDGKTLLASCHGNTAGAVHLWDAATGRYRSRLYADTAGPGQLAVSPDSRLLAASASGGLRVWDLTSGKELAPNEEAHKGEVLRVVAAGDLVITAGDDHSIRFWDPATGTQRRKLTHGYRVGAIAVSPDGTRLVSSSLDDTVCLWDVATGRKIYTLPGHGKLGGRRAVGFTPDGKHFLSWGDDLYLRKWDVTTGKAILEQALRPKGVKVPEEGDERDGRELHFNLGDGTFAQDGKTFVLYAGNEFHVFDLTTGKEVRQIAGEGGYVIAHAVSPDGRWLLASAWGKPIETKLPDGRTRHSAAKNHPICLWELSTGKLHKQVLLPGGGAGPVAFSADCKLFAAATSEPDRRIRVWDLASGEEIGVIQGFRHNVRCLAFTPDGKRLISGMDDTTALVWDWKDKR